MEEPAQSPERANPLTSEGGVQIDLTEDVCLNSDMATLDNDDLRALKELIEVTIDEKELVSKNNISHLPTKDEFYVKMDEVMGELKTIREEQVVQSHQLSDHGDRIEKIEVNANLSAN